MSKSKLGMSSFDIDIKFKDKDEAYRYAKRLIEKIRYISNKKGWSAEAMVCISNIKGNSTYQYYEHSGNVGRPKRVKAVHKYRDNGINVEWHIHILLVSKPMYSFREELKRYIDKNWYKGERKKKDFDITKLYGKGTYKKDTNINKAEYFIDQADKILFCNSFSNEIIPNGYSLKDLYNIYMKYKTATRYAKSTGNRKRLALEDKYHNIREFYFNITKEQDKRIIDRYMKEAQLIKIAENYERLENGNKVQENYDIHRVREEEITPF